MTTRPWYTPSGFMVRWLTQMTKIAASIYPDWTYSIGFAAAAIDVLGIKGTTKYTITTFKILAKEISIIKEIHHASTKRRPAKSNSQML